MKLFEALALRKALQSDLGQLISIRNSTFTYPSDEKPEFEFVDLTQRIKQKVNDVTMLKVQIMKANMENVLPNGLSLYASIIELANIRSAIEQLQNLMQVDRGILGYRRSRTEELKMVKQKEPAQLLDMIQEQEAKRRLLDSMIQDANHTLDVEFKGKSA